MYVESDRPGYTKQVFVYPNGVDSVYRPILPPDEHERRVESLKRAMVKLWDDLERVHANDPNPHWRDRYCHDED